MALARISWDHLVYVTSGMALSIYMTHVWWELLILFVGFWDLFEYYNNLYYNKLYPTTAVTVARHQALPNYNSNSSAPSAHA
jgi:hypothetical protein